VGRNVVERNPAAKAELSLADLEQRFRTFIDQYHQEMHSATGQTPFAFWQEHATPLPVDERLLDMLLKELTHRHVLKEGIKYAGERYWHPELAVLVGEEVLVRAAPCYTAPDELEVFFGEQWRCTAFALSSPKGQAVQRKEVVEAQRRQRGQACRRINAAREALETPHPLTTEQRKGRQATPPHEVLVAPLSSPRAPDLFDFLVARAAQARKDAPHDS
jgi:hypothetical protein